MGQFQYRAADAEGKVVEGTIDAPEQAAVIARLQDRGLIPIRIVVAGERKASAGSRFANFVPKRRAGSRDLLILTQELSALIGAGLPLALSLARGRVVVSVGRVAHRALGGHHVRHPAHGGARDFRAGLVELRHSGDLLPGSA